MMITKGDTARRLEHGLDYLQSREAKRRNFPTLGSAGAKTDFSGSPRDLSELLDALISEGGCR